MLNGTVALEGSKRHLAGLDTLPENFDDLSEKDQNKALAEAAKVGAKRKAAVQKMLDDAKAAGEEFVVTVKINGVDVSGKVDWNSAEDGLRARINFSTTGIQGVAKAKSRKVNKQRHFLGL
jgi:hypothetical protein